MMRVRSRILAAQVAVLVTAALALGGCGSDPDASDAPDDVETVSMVWAGGNILTYLPLTYAIDAGYMEEEGVKLDILKVDAGGDVVRAIVGKQAEFGPVALDGLIASRNAGAQLKAFVQMTKLPGQTMLVRSDLAGEIREFSDLGGRAIGIAAKGTSTDFQAQLAAQIGGVDVGDYSLVAVGNGQTALAALSAKQIDILITAEPATSLAINDLGAKVLWDGRTSAGSLELYGGDSPVLMMAANEDTLASRSEAARRIAAALRRALEDISSKSAAEIAAVIKPENQGIEDRDEYVKVIENMIQVFGGPELSESGAQLSIDMLARFDEAVAAAKPEVSTLFTNEFLTEE